MLMQHASGDLHTYQLYDKLRNETDFTAVKPKQLNYVEVKHMGPGYLNGDLLSLSPTTSLSSTPLRSKSEVSETVREGEEMVK